MENQLYDYSPIVRRPRLELPNGARVAFWIGLNIEHHVVDRPGASIAPAFAGNVPDPLNYGWRDYAPRVGVWRTMDALDQYGVRASVLLNSDVCHFYPEIIEEGNLRRWAWLAHGKNNSTMEAGMEEEVERSYLTDVVRTITEGTGQAPKGWLGPGLTETFNTPDILADLGVNYLLDWCNDDQPFPMKVKNGKKMISVPYSIELNDLSLFLGKNLSGDDFYRLVCDQFDTLYEEGANSARVMCLALHPFVISMPFRQKYLKQVLAYVAGHDDVWLTTSDEIAAWYYDNYYEQALAQSRPRGGMAAV